METSTGKNIEKDINIKTLNKIVDNIYSDLSNEIKSLIKERVNDLLLNLRQEKIETIKVFDHLAKSQNSFSINAPYNHYI